MINAFASIEETLGALSSGAISASELLEAHLERIKRLDPKLNAFVDVFDEQARQEARCHDAITSRLMADEPLRAIPIAIKDLFDYGGAPTRAGSLSTSSEKKVKSASAVKSLRTAGAIIHGKTHTAEFAFGGWGTNPVMGTPWNPWDLKNHRVPGGSSSGSAVAVAAGMAMAALGTDTGGSIRTPASHCGVVGVKTSPGMISREGVFPLCPTNDTVGVMARFVRDAVLVLNVIAGPDVADTLTLGCPRIDVNKDIERGVKGLRIGILPARELTQVEVPILRLMEDTLSGMVTDGAVVSEFAPPAALEDYLSQSFSIMTAESYFHHGDLVEMAGSLVDKTVAARIRQGRTVTAADYLRLLQTRRESKVHFLDSFDRLDALLMPTCANVPIAVTEVDEAVVVSPFGRFVNYLDMSAVSVPIGLVPPGLPVGLQIVVRQFDDALALRIARTVEIQRGTFFPPGL